MYFVGDGSSFSVISSLLTLGEIDGYKNAYESRDIIPF